jgi:Protein of unknown function (DUF559)
MPRRPVFRASSCAASSTGSCSVASTRPPCWQTPWSCDVEPCSWCLPLVRHSVTSLRRNLYGVPASHPLIHVSMSSSKCRPRSRAGLQLHESVPNADVTIFRNLPLTTPERTFLDLAGCVDRVELVIVGDALLRRRRASVTSLRSTVELARGRRRVCLAREALPLLRDGVDSPMETRLRLLLVSAGLPCPEINTDIIDERGHWLSRPDLLYRDLKIAMEYEGDTHRTDKRQWRADMTRHEVLHDLGWVVLRFHADDILLRPHQTVDRVRQWIHVRSRDPSDARVGSRS